MNTNSRSFSPQLGLLQFLIAFRPCQPPYPSSLSSLTSRSAVFDRWRRGEEQTLLLGSHVHQHGDRGEEGQRCQRGGGVTILFNHSTVKGTKREMVCLIIRFKISNFVGLDRIFAEIDVHLCLSPYSPSVHIFIRRFLLISFSYCAHFH
jgi:hypothetical protein